MYLFIFKSLLFLFKVGLFCRLEAEDGHRPAKRRCLVTLHKTAQVKQTQELDSLYNSEGVQACLERPPPDRIEEGPCGCLKCTSSVGISIPQLQFTRNRRGGYVVTREICKEYRLVMSKRWLCREHRGRSFPFATVTLPFGTQCDRF